MNDTIKTIMNRKSVRKFSDKSITEQDVRTILQAGMSGPSCVNSRCWSFIVVQDKEGLLKMADANVKYADPLRGATLGILVCGDLSRTEFFASSREFWVIDGAIAAQNMIDRVGAFYDAYIDLGKKLKSVTTAYNSGISKLKEGGQSITTSAKQVMELGVKRSKGKEFIVPDQMIEIESDNE